jgi:ferritin-like metal-binding protein YciE
MTTLNTLKDLLIDKLQDLHNAETQVVKALPKMAEAAGNVELKAVFIVHLGQTKEHIERLERALDILNASPTGKTCYPMKSLVEESDEAINTLAPEAIRDANLIGAAQRVKHYEIAAYSTVCSVAEKLFENEVAAMLQLTLDEECDTERHLTLLLEIVNEAASSVVNEMEGASVKTLQK